MSANRDRNNFYLTFDQWIGVVDDYINERTGGLNVNDYEYDYQAAYNLGMQCNEAAEQAIAAES